MTVVGLFGYFDKLVSISDSEFPSLSFWVKFDKIN